MDGISYINEELEIVNRKISDILSSENKKMGEILKWAYSRKGKQLRPQFVLASSRFGTKYSDVSDVAAIIEIIHLASLVQDDIVDNSKYRRGGQSVQYKYGVPMAIYAGDYMLFSAFALETLWDCKRLISLITKATRKVLGGELNQHMLLYDMSIKPDQYLKNIAEKTGVLFSVACEAGAMAAGADENVIQSLSDFGLCYGIIFQIRDDFLDFFSKKK